MQLGETVVHKGNYNFTKFYKKQMKNKKVLLIARFSVQNFKVSVESWKLYIVLALFGMNNNIAAAGGLSKKNFFEFWNKILAKIDFDITK